MKVILPAASEHIQYSVCNHENVSTPVCLLQDSLHCVNGGEVGRGSDLWSAARNESVLL